jgi:hypothetical protein
MKITRKYKNNRENLKANLGNSKCREQIKKDFHESGTYKIILEYA